MIRLKTDKEIAIIKKGGAILESILDEVISLVKPGVTTAELETLACELMRQVGGKPSFKDYQSSPKDKPFPTALCTSINFEVVHVPAIPGRVLNPGDIIGIDIGMIYEGLFTDMAKTVAVGPISNLAKRLLKVTEAALYKGIDQVKPGNSVWDIGKAIEDYVLANGFSVVKDLAGHGVGFTVHEDPTVPNYTEKGLPTKGIILRKGMVIAIEPMVNIGGYEIETLKDGFSIVTRDRSLSAQFEHTVAVVDGGVEILTKK